MELSARLKISQRNPPLWVTLKDVFNLRLFWNVIFRVPVIIVLQPARELMVISKSVVEVPGNSRQNEAQIEFSRLRMDRHIPLLSTNL